jgi:hypothetical protein
MRLDNKLSATFAVTDLILNLTNELRNKSDGEIVSY